ncbi:flagellar basal-body MS-ring/collar protein FliF [Dyella tabacisoli]|uniref:Flagellar M-ring protein n=1 Tax=Dyella tabacisoli TaxID=2282381 RepID=A0A369UG95_9GAMM|nr:flagellar basal-body MS-ring/collar protein FliF [Dyella tabacisoli]RDD79752.1 flagellar M-ring protein FliF [Dyella tabacisoli]
MAETAIAKNTSELRLGSLKNLAQNPAARQLLLLVAVAAAVALGVAIVLWSRGPSYGLLYAGLESKDAAAITQTLQASNTPYQLSSDGSSISVPAADLAALRLKLAAQGLPQGSAGSAAVPANDSPFGMSDLAERTRYQQLLETDLGSTIAGLQSVRSARVHLALPKPSAFIRDNRQASASVLLTLYQGRQLDASQVAAIVHLVAASVPDLDPRQVSVIDQQGQLLTVSDPDSPGAIGDTRLRMATRIENTYAQRVEALLTPLVGAGKVRAQVYADLDFSQTEKATETFGHDKPALRSEQTSSEQHSDSRGAVPGALSNQPPTAAAQPTAAKPGAAPTASSAQSNANGSTSSNATRNYELDRTISHVSDPAGRLARLTVAVLVDNKSISVQDGVSQDKSKSGNKSVPFTTQELQHLTELARNAVGYNEARGDSVSVINQPFHEVAEEGEPPGPSLWQRPGMLDLLKQGVGILLAVLIAFGLLRPLLRGLIRGPEPAKALPGPTSLPTVSVRIDDDPLDAPEPGLPGRISAPQAVAYEQKISSAKRMVSENPKQVAQVVKSWVSDDGG